MLAGGLKRRLQVMLCGTGPVLFVVWVLASGFASLRSAPLRAASGRSERNPFRYVPGSGPFSAVGRQD
jgi:hypothetical protein